MLLMALSHYVVILLYVLIIQKEHIKMTYTLYRKCPRTGLTETIQYEGALRNKPKGWHVK